MWREINLLIFCCPAKMPNFYKREILVFYKHGDAAPEH